MEVHFFLANGATLEPALPAGVPQEAALAAAGHSLDDRRATRLPNDPVLADFGADPGELSAQRWGIIAPRGEQGEQLLQLIEPLRQHRAKQQLAEEVEVYKVDPDMSAEATDGWILNEYRDRVGGITGRLPRYLLIIGGPEQVSWDMQQQLASVAMVGRLSFQGEDGLPDEEGFKAYVNKVLSWENERARRAPHVVLYSVQDGDGAMLSGRTLLLAPSADLLRMQEPEWPIEEIGLKQSPLSNADLRRHRAEMLEAVRQPATVLFSVTHGCGGNQWAHPDDQRKGQGNLKMGPEVMTAADIKDATFLPGGVWFAFACFSAGTPTRSLFSRWIGNLREMNRSLSIPEDTLKSAPLDGRPFVAALPQAALRNPNGPLAVIGHVDLALTHSFLRKDYSPGGRSKPYPDRFADVLVSLTRGRRVGVAFDMVARGFRELDSALTSRHAAAGGPAQSGAAEGDENVKRANLSALWLARQDIQSFVLLGDPAARLPLRGRDDASLRTMEEAVLKHLGGEPIEDVAATAGVSQKELALWVDTFMEGARDALSRLKGT